MIRPLFALMLGAAAAASAQTPAAAPETLTLQQALSFAEDASPELKAVNAQELQAEDQVAISQSSLYPSLEGQAAAGYGFLGGNNSFLGVQSLVINQENHIGPVGGVYSTLEVFNASTYMTIALAKKNLDYFKALTALTRYQVDLAAARVYFDAARDRGDAAAWREAGDEMRGLMSEVQAFVRSGYQNPLDVLLVKDQVTQADIEQRAADARYRQDLVALAALLGRDASSLSCPPASSLSEGVVDVFAPGASPYLLLSQSQVSVAQATVSQKKAANYPVLRAIGSADTGSADSRYLPVDRDYSVGVGLTLPIFEGFRISKQTKQARDLLSQRQFERDSSQVQLAAQDAVFEGLIDSARSEVQGLAPEYGDDQQALRLARQRYRNFQGRLVDVREALRDLARVGVARNDFLSELLFALTGKSLLDGGTVKR